MTAVVASDHLIGLDPKNVELLATDRCDRCGAQAYVRTHLISGGHLLWCNHHWTGNADKVMPLVEHLHDERSILDELEHPKLAAE